MTREHWISDDVGLIEALNIAYNDKDESGNHLIKFFIYEKPI